MTGVSGLLRWRSMQVTADPPQATFASKAKSPARMKRKGLRHRWSRRRPGDHISLWRGSTHTQGTAGFKMGRP